MNNLTARRVHNFRVHNRPSRWAAVLLTAVSPVACDAIVGAGAREFDPSIVCDDAGCACAEGRGDCDGDADNGCETDLNQPANCGACGNVCDNGDCQNLTCACEGGFADCDGNPVTVCETDLQNDGSHCGSCERDCLGGTCKNGLCEPQMIPNTNAYGFGVHHGDVYFTHLSQPGLFRAPANGGLAEKFSDSDALGLIVRIYKDQVVWSATDSVVSTPLDGSPSTVIAQQVEPLYQMWVGGDQVYFDAPDDMMPTFSALMRVPLAGGAPEKITVLGETKFLVDFAASEAHVYWDDVTLIRRAPHDSTTASDFLNSPTSPTFFSADDKYLYFAGSQSGTYAVPLTGGAASEIADAAPGYGSIQSDGENVYFLTFADGDAAVSVWRVPRDGAAPAVKLAEDAYAYSGQPISVDDEWVYWLSETAVARVPK
ncbi:MAG: hypothetical protein IPK82_28430 [Polyangiaceae bacterium]|nr:hypothetical protein [Polyangiaceae bacterium]